MRLLRLTLFAGPHDRTPVFISAEAIRAFHEKRNDGGAQTRVYIGETHPLSVRETPDEIVELLGAGRFVRSVADA